MSVSPADRSRLPFRRLPTLTFRCLSLVISGGLSTAAWADFEEVRILRADPVQYQNCPQPAYAPPPYAPPGQQAAVPPPGYPPPPAAYPAAAYPPPPGAPQPAYPPPGYPQGATAPPGYPQAANPQPAYPQAGTPPPGYPAPGYPQQAQVPPPQSPQPVAGGLTGREIVGGVAGAAIGGLLGNQVGRGAGRTAATVAGAGVGAYAGYKIAEEKPQQPPPAMQAAPMQTGQVPPACTFITHYRVQYSRPNGMPGEVMMTSQPTGASLMINFCGDRPC